MSLKIFGGKLMNNIFTEQGGFFTGCNYWTSHAGTAMWADWRADIVENDFKKLSEAGLKVLRVFPLWPDFQPVKSLKGYVGRHVEYRIGEEVLSDDEEGLAGVSKAAIEHFEEFAALAEKYGLKLIVGLITGWMSGRLFVPPALESRNVITDPLAIQWEVRFVKYFVKRFKNCPAIIAWDLGNECNCMAEVPSPEAAWNWVSSITNAIKSVDSARPVVSGMHSLKTEGNWTIQDQGEILDILTTHPYPSPTYNSNQDPMNTIRIGLHASAQSLLYCGVGGKPCFAEEVGTFGPMFASDRIGADFIRNNLFTLWAHDCRGFLWWCANEQSHLEHAPYDWDAIERELGLFRIDSTPKPVLGEISRFTEFVENFKYGKLPERIVDGICILTKGQGGDGAWGAAYSAFVLAKQAGLDIEYSYSEQPIKDSNLYIVPSIRGNKSFSRHRLKELLGKIYNGAVLYISTDDGVLSPFEEYSGIEIQTREKCTETDIITLDSDIKLDIRGSFKFKSVLKKAKLIGVDQEGNPAYTCSEYGKGKVFFLSYPLETYLFNKPGAFHRANAKPYWMIYRHIKESLVSKKVVEKEDPFVGVTEHIVDSNKRVIVAINYKPEAVNASLRIKEGWKADESIYGPSEFQVGDNGGINIFIPGNDAVVFTLIKQVV
jgi:endo-1,4-beta-mannosidase